MTFSCTPLPTLIPQCMIHISEILGHRKRFESQRVLNLKRLLLWMHFAIEPPELVKTVCIYVGI